jgi:hypothetical protein
MPDDLVALAQRLLDLDKETAAVRSRMLTLLANGHGEPAAAHPTQPREGAKRTQAKGAKPHPNAAKAAVIEGQIVALLKERPMGRGEIAKATQGKASSTQMRLTRLLEKGLVQRGERGLWSASSTPT